MINLLFICKPTLFDFYLGFDDEEGLWLLIVFLGWFDDGLIMIITGKFIFVGMVVRGEKWRGGNGSRREEHELYWVK